MKLRNSSSVSATEREKFIRQLMEDFEIGDVVQLRSGGPKLTVHSLVSDCDVVCQWFEGDELHEEGFPREALRKVELVTPDGNRRADGVFMVS